MPEVFARDGRRKLAREHEAKIHELHAKIGEFTVERDLSARVEPLSRAERFGMIEPKGPASLSRQCVLLGVSRSSLYYRPKGAGAEILALMRRMDELHMEHPFYGSRQMMRHLRREGVAVGRHRSRRLMPLMGVEATYRRLRTSAANPEHLDLPLMDWATRHVLAWRLSNTMDATFCVEALDDALLRATPEILNTGSECLRAGSLRVV